MVACASGPSFSHAQTLPGPADAGRVGTQLNERERPTTGQGAPQSPRALPLDIPSGADDVRIVFAKPRIEGVSVFTQDELAPAYADLVGKEVPLSELWKVAERITALYLERGYFLSRAMVPPQETSEGALTIRVVEGYIGSVDMRDTNLQGISLVEEMLEDLQQKKPLTVAELESTMLRLNDFAGVSIRAVVEPLEDAPPGAVGLVLAPAEAKAKARISVDNFGSRFLGPYQGSVLYQDAFVPLQRTTLSLSRSLEFEELGYAALAHEIPINSLWKWEVNGSYVEAKPGYTLERNDISSDSVTLGMRLAYQPIRQRRENLKLYAGIDGRNTNGDIVDAPLTRDRIRAFEAGAEYDTIDAAGGYHGLQGGLRRGLDILGSSDEGDVNLSRAEAEPDFTLLQMSYAYQRWLADDWLSLANFNGQWAFDPLYSAEEFGYGGQRFGRAYDPSELTGDTGAAASFELRYQGIEAMEEFHAVPFAFYDVGRVWNRDVGKDAESAMSAGGGVIINHDSGAEAMIGVALPLTRPADNPLYGSGHAPRWMLELSYTF